MLPPRTINTASDWVLSHFESHALGPDIKMNIIFITPLVLLIAVQSVVCSGVHVKVKNGWLEGEKLDFVNKEGWYYSFKGIQYGQTPNGTLRFKAPRPALPWQGVRSAKDHGPVCHQKDILTNLVVPADEDCLYLNVYSPSLKPKRLKSVIVFIHGGGFTSGSGNVDIYGPDFLVQHDAVLVTFNYRLGALGFLSLGTEAVPGNAGLKDQVLVLKWVKSNIAKFGGDPNKVTIMGQGAGAASVGLHLRSPMSTGLFHRAIAMSGSPTCDWALSFRAEERALSLGKALGLDTKNPHQLLKYLQKVPAESLVTTTAHIVTSEVYTDNVLKMFPFAPVEENCYGSENFLTAQNSETINEVEIFYGHNNEEVATVMEPITATFVKNYNTYLDIWVPEKLLRRLDMNDILEISSKLRNFYFGEKCLNMSTIREFVDYGNDATFKYDTMKYFLERTGERKAKYAYQFSFTSSRNVYGAQGTKYGIYGAARLDELMYVFDPKSLNLNSTEGSIENELINQFCTIVTDFVKYADPFYSVDLIWPLSDLKNKIYVDLTNVGAEVSTEEISLNVRPRWQFWESLYDCVGGY